MCNRLYEPIHSCFWECNLLVDNSDLTYILPLTVDLYKSAKFTWSPLILCVERDACCRRESSNPCLANVSENVGWTKFQSWGITVGCVPNLTGRLFSNTVSKLCNVTRTELNSKNYGRKNIFRDFNNSTLWVPLNGAKRFLHVVCVYTCICVCVDGWMDVPLDSAWTCGQVYFVFGI